MASVINTNIPSLNAQRNLSASNSSLQISLQRLSSGLRINSAKDDAAGLAISERFTAQIRGADQARRNANDGVSLAQTGEGALQQMGDILQRIRELAVQAGNATNSSSDRAAINAEVGQLAAELDRFAQTTEFNGQKLFDGSTATSIFQVGANANQTITVTNTNLRTNQYGSYQVGNGSGTGIPATTAYVTGSSTVAAGATGTVNTAGTVVTASGTFSVNGVSITVTGTDQAKDIAAKINAANAGVTASARTEVTLSLGSGAYDLTLASRGNTFQSVAFNVTDQNNNGTVDADEYQQAINAFNAKSSQTGVIAQLVSYQDSTKTTQYGIRLVADDGSNIALSSNGTVASGFGGAVTVWNYDTTNSTGSTQYLAGTTVLSAGATGTVTFAGQVTVNSSSSYSLTTSGAAFASGVFTVNTSTGTTVTLGSGTSMTAQLKTVDKLDVSTVEGATQALRIVDDALTRINDQRAKFGALQSRFEATINNLQISTENLSAARSRIRDADFASETANLTRAQILQQAGTAMLTQANSLPNQTLALLRG